jgi:hypothetical protein
LRSDLDNVTADDVEAGQAAEDAKRLCGSEPADFRCTGTRRKCRVQGIDVKADIGRALARYRARFFDHPLDTEFLNLFGVNNCHSRGIGKLPKILGIAANTDLYSPAGVQHAVKYGLPERAAMVKLAALERAAGIAMSIDVDHANRTIAANGAKQRQSYRVIAANRERNDSGLDDVANIPLDILVGTGQIETAAKGHVTHICDADVRRWNRPQHMIIRPDSFDVANGTGPETGTRAVRHAQIQRDAEERDVDVLKTRRGVLP